MGHRERVRLTLVTRTGRIGCVRLGKNIRIMDLRQTIKNIVLSDEYGMSALHIMQQTKPLFPTSTYKEVKRICECLVCDNEIDKYPRDVFVPPHSHYDRYSKFYEE